MCVCHRDNHVITAVFSCHSSQLHCAHECNMFKNLRRQPRYEDSLRLCSWAVSVMPNWHKQIPSLKGLSRDFYDPKDGDGDGIRSLFSHESPREVFSWLFTYLFFLFKALLWQIMYCIVENCR